VHEIRQEVLDEPAKKSAKKAPRRDHGPSVEELLRRRSPLRVGDVVDAKGTASGFFGVDVRASAQGPLGVFAFRVVGASIVGEMVMTVSMQGTVTYRASDTLDVEAEMQGAVRFSPGLAMDGSVDVDGGGTLRLLGRREGP